MSETITFVADRYEVASNLNNFSFPPGEKDGLKWEWKVSSGLSINNSTGKLQEYVFLSWKFDWEELHGYEGTITAKYNNGNTTCPFVAFEVDLCRSGKWIQKRITALANADFYKKFRFEFKLTPVQKTKRIVILESIFAESEFTDVALVVKDKKIFMNKTMLSCHSDYFRAMFASDFQEKSMKEIPIEDVKYEDFAALLSLITTNPLIPTVDNIVQILKLADRFLMPAVPKNVQFFILKMDEIKFDTILLLSHTYEQLEETKKKCVQMLKFQDEIKNMTEREEFKKLDDAVKVEFLMLAFKLPLKKDSK